MQHSKKNEARIRRLAQRKGYRITRSRQRTNVPNLDNLGDFMLVNVEINACVMGERYNASLEDIEAYLKA